MSLILSVPTCCSGPIPLASPTIRVPDALYSGSPAWTRTPGSMWQAARPLITAPDGLLRPLPVPGRPWSHIALDFVTGLPVSRGKSVILTTVDLFRKQHTCLPRLPAPTVPFPKRLTLPYPLLLTISAVARGSGRRLYSLGTHPGDLSAIGK